MKALKNLISVVICLFAACLLFAGAAVASSSEEAPLGSEGNPYLIESWTDFRARLETAKEGTVYLKLMNNIKPDKNQNINAATDAVVDMNGKSITVGNAVCLYGGDHSLTFKNGTVKTMMQFFSSDPSRSPIYTLTDMSVVADYDVCVNIGKANGALVAENCSFESGSLSAIKISGEGTEYRLANCSMKAPTGTPAFSYTSGTLMLEGVPFNASHASNSYSPISHHPHAGGVMLSAIPMSEMDFTASGQLIISSNTALIENASCKGVGEIKIAADSDITLCLNGHTLDLGSNFIDIADSKLTICDCAGGGIIRSANDDQAVLAGQNGELILLGAGIENTVGYAVKNDNNCTISGGTVVGAVGGIFNTASLEISGNAAVEGEYGIENTGELFVLGGSVVGALENAIYNSGSLYLAGAPVISAGEGQADIYSGVNAIYAADKSSAPAAWYTGEGLEIELSSYTNGAVAVNSVNSESMDKFSLKNADYCLILGSGSNESCLIIKARHSHIGVLGVFDGLSVIGSKLTGGRYYLESSLTAEADITISANADVTICLNGKSLNLSEQRIKVEAGARLTICECQSAPGSCSGTNGAILNYGTVRISGGKIIATEAHAMTNSTGGTLIVEGGSVNGKSYAVSNGGALYLSLAPTVSGSTDADILCHAGGVVYPHAKEDPAKVYSGEALTLYAATPENGLVLVSGVNASTKDKFAQLDQAEAHTLVHIGNELLLHSHLWSAELDSDEAHHWRHCENFGCFITEKSEMNGYESHSEPIDDGDCKTDVRCFACEYVLISAKDAHSYIYTASGAVITEKCADPACTVHEATATLMKPAGELVYNGADEFGASVVYSENWAGNNELEIVHIKGGAPTADTKGAGEYSAYITLEGAVASVEYSVGRALSFIGITAELDKIYDGEAVAAPTMNNGYTYNGDADVVIRWYDDLSGAPGTELGHLPRDSGTYWIVICAEQTENYLAAPEVSQSFCIDRAQTTADVVGEFFSFTAPQGTIYDGASKSAAFARIRNGGIGDIYEIKYYRGDTELDGAPAGAGSYTVKISVGQGKNYNSAVDISDVAWAFTIERAQAVIAVDTSPIVKTYGEAWELPSASSDFGTPIADLTLEQMANADTYTLTFTVAETDNYRGDTASISVTVKKQRTAKPTADESAFTYNGTALEYKLEKSPSYTVSGNVRSNAGEYKVTVALKDKNNFEWEDGTTDDLKLDFKIGRAQYDMSGIKFENGAFVYDGAPHIPKLSGELPIGADGIAVTVRYSKGATEASDGETTVIASFATASPNYDAPAPMSATVRIIPKKIEINWAADSFTYNGTDQKQSVKAYYLDAWGEPVYLSVSLDGEFKSFNDSGYVFVASFAADETNYRLPDNATKAYHIKRLDISGAELTLGPPLTYTGAEQTQGISSVKLGDMEVTYSVVGNRATNVGASAYELIVSGTGNFTGNVSARWNIAPRKLTASVELGIASGSFIFNGQKHEPRVFVYDGDILIPAYEYSVAYSDNIFAGNATVAIEDVPGGNYIVSGGTVFYIDKQSVGRPMPDATVFTYNGAEQSYKVAENVLYTVVGNKRTDAGAQSVKISLVDKENYKWSDGTGEDITFGFAIQRQSVPMPVRNDSSFTYNGEFHSYLTRTDARYSVTGNLRRDAGSQTVRVELIDRSNYMWEDGSDSEIDFEFVVAKANAIVSVDTTPIIKVYGESLELPVATGNFGRVTVDKTPADLKNAGSYTVTYKIAQTANYNGDSRTVNVTVSKARVEKPEGDTAEFVYNGAEQTYSVPKSALYSVSGDTRTDAGSQNVVISLVDKSNYEWSDATSGDLSLLFTISKARVEKPESDATEFVYNGAEQTYDVPKNALYTVLGDTRTDAGAQLVRISLADPLNYEWADGSAGDIFFGFEIGRADAVINVDTTPIVKTYGEAFELPTASSNVGKIIVDKTPADLKNAGSYTVTYSVAATENHNGDTETLKVTVSRAKVEKPKEDETAFVYTGAEQTYGVRENVLYKISGNKRTNAGLQAVRITLADKANYEWEDGTVDDLIFAFIISRADARLRLDEASIVKYCGESWELPKATSTFGNVVCDKAVSDMSRAGSYTVIYSVASTENYNGDSKALSVTVKKAVYDMSGVKFEDMTVVYSGQAFEVAIDGALPRGVTVEYSGNGMTDVGEYTVTAGFKGDENHEAIAPMTATLRIERASYDMSGVKFEDRAFIYSGKAFELAIDGALPHGVSVEYIGNSQSELGEHTVIAEFSGNENYNAITPMRATLTVKSDLLWDHVGTPSIIASGAQGFADEAEIVITEVENLEPGEWLGHDEEIGAVFDITIRSQEAVVQPNGVMTIRLLIPKELRENAFRIVHLHGGEHNEVEYTVEGDYAVFEVDKLSEFVFVNKREGDGGDALWLGILLLVLAVIIVFMPIVLNMNRKKQAK